MNESRESGALTLVLLRHGESVWNKENRFTGWTDVDLSDRGVAEAHEAGAALRDRGYRFDIAFTSVLRRAINTLHIVLDEMDLLWIPEVKTWRLNERHYGALQGLNKSETAGKYGEGQVKIWRRSYDVPPPALGADDERNPARAEHYRGIDPGALPLAESLKDTVARFLPFWHDAVVPALRNGKRAIIAAHGNSIRALVKYLDGVSDEQIAGLDIPTGIPLVYELGTDLRPLRHFYLADEERINQAIAAVAQQGSAK